MSKSQRREWEARSEEEAKVERSEIIGAQRSASS
jgi:hypothetical protein